MFQCRIHIQLSIRPIQIQGCQTTYILMRLRTVSDLLDGQSQPNSLGKSRKNKMEAQRSTDRTRFGTPRPRETRILLESLGLTGQQTKRSLDLCLRPTVKKYLFNFIVLTLIKVERNSKLMFLQNKNFETNDFELCTYFEQIK